jgi:ribosomal protein S13
MKTEVLNKEQKKEELKTEKEEDLTQQFAKKVVVGPSLEYLSKLSIKQREQLGIYKL